MKTCNTIKANLKMQGYHILSCERESQKGGGLACIYNENLKMKAPKSHKYESFETTYSANEYQIPNKHFLTYI